MKLAFALEYCLGHATHAENFKSAILQRPEVNAHLVDIPYHETPLPKWTRILGPARRNWSVRASLSAAHGMKQFADLDGAFFHTQVTSLFSVRFMQRVPSVISLDATPVQYDSLGKYYNHSAGTGVLERVKKGMNKRAFQAARHLVTWSHWAKGSLVADYGIPAEKITVIPPGIDLKQWQFNKRDDRGPFHILFVGNDFSRKGGETLLAAFKLLRRDFKDAVLTVVTASPNAGDGEPGVTVHRGLKPNSAALLEQFAAANVFAFPTFGDTFGLALLEAMASGLPVVTTRVGAIAEVVEDGKSGYVIDENTPAALAESLARLADPKVRATMSIAARERVAASFDATTNFNRLIDLLINTTSK